MTNDHLNNNRFLTNRRGFTLLEFSMVLVITGLLAGGIVSSWTLIHQAQLSKVISQLQQIAAAVNAYQAKYSALPGDDPNAQTVFGSTDCPDLNSGLNTCNGTGNGYIRGPTVTSGETYESRRVAQHLSLAKLIPGGYTGNASDSAQKLFQGSVVANAEYRIGYTDTGSFPTGLYNTYGHAIILADQSSFPTNNGKSALTVSDMVWIDTKMDDGYAATGNIRALDGANVTTAHCVSSSIYVTATTTVSCALYDFLDNKIP